jgi:hypothetical protein
MIVCESGGHANGLTYFIFRFLRRPLVTRGESAKHQKIAPYRIQKTPKKSIRKGAFLRQKTTQNTDTEEKQKKANVIIN